MEGLASRESGHDFPSVFTRTRTEIKQVMGGWPPRPGGIKDAMALVDDAMVADLIAYGTPDECFASAQRWMDAGLDQMILIPLSRNYDEIMEVFAP